MREFLSVREEKQQQQVLQQTENAETRADYGHQNELRQQVRLWLVMAVVAAICRFVPHSL